MREKNKVIVLETYFESIYDKVNFGCLNERKTYFSNIKDMFRFFTYIIAIRRICGKLNYVSSITVF